MSTLPSKPSSHGESFFKVETGIPLPPARRGAAMKKRKSGKHKKRKTTT